MEVQSHLCSAVQAPNVVPLRRNLLRVPACAQCRTAMTVDRFEPELEAGSLPELEAGSLMATFRCITCGLRDRHKINPDHAARPVDADGPGRAGRVRTSAGRQPEGKTCRWEATSCFAK
jgi:hypothetical protein